MKYFITLNGKKQGPLSFEQLRELNLFNTTLVWKEGMDQWRPANEVEELKEITLTPPPPIPQGKPSISEIIKIFFIHLFFGFGFFYVDKSLIRKYLYPAFAIYIVIDIYFATVDTMEPFSGEFGYYSFLASLTICYVIGYIDVFVHRYKISHTERL